MTRLKTTVPFGGFYSSIHSQEIDDQLEQCFSNDQGDSYSFLIEKAINQADWSNIYNEYAKEYVDALVAEFDLKIEFETLISPKYYNFETDRIFAYIELSEVERLFNSVPKEALEQKIKERFTSRDGFISHYPNKLAEWPSDLIDWDHNHIGTLIEVYIETIEPEFDQYQEYSLLSDQISNGMMYAIFDSNIENIERLYKICDYLRERENRVVS